MDGNIICEAAKAFPEAVLPDSEEFYRGVIGECADIYRGQPPWAYVKRSGLYGRGERRISMLCCAKALCDCMAALTFSGQADIKCADPKQKSYAERVLQENGFWEKMPAFLSRAYALGGGAMRIFIDGGKVCIDFVDAEGFVPTGGGGVISEGIFASSLYRNGNSYRLMEKHGRHKRRGYAVIDRALFLVKGSGYTRVPVSRLSDGLEEHSEYPLMDMPMFSYFRPAGDNNLSGSLLGLSCFANCRDTLKAIDIAFDSFTREFILGRKRIIVPSSCIRTVVDPETGKICRYFDHDDEVYQALKCDEEKDLRITDNTCELRVQEHIDAINALLDILCFQAGLSAGSLSFAQGGLRTATEIKSRENRTDMTMMLNRGLCAELIENALRCIIRCGQMCGEVEAGDISLRIEFSDKQAVDRGEVIDRNIRLVGAGLLSRISAVMAVLDCSEAEAAAELERINGERRDRHE